MFKPEQLINDPGINSLIESGNYSDAAKRLLTSQKEHWKTLTAGYGSLNSIKTKRINFEGFSFIIQFNPGRIISSSALTDKKSIKERKCFLCCENLPAEQRGILINNYLLLINPFPIFPEHYTIPATSHKDQRIKDGFTDLLYITKLLSKYYAALYNGPQCGASAPDHMHFQAGNKAILPLYKEYEVIKNNYGEILARNNDDKIIGVDDGLRKMVCLESKNKDSLIELFNSFYDIYKVCSNAPEPMMNIVSFYKEEVWQIIIMLRSKHRPEEFYRKGEERILFSPAGSDFGGICVTPMEKDYYRIDKDLLVKIFNEVSIGTELFVEIKKEIKTRFL